MNKKVGKNLIKVSIIFIIGILILIMGNNKSFASDYPKYIYDENTNTLKYQFKYNDGTQTQDLTIEIHYTYDQANKEFVMSNDNRNDYPALFYDSDTAEDMYDESDSEKLGYKVKRDGKNLTIYDVDGNSKGSYTIDDSDFTKKGSTSPDSKTETNIVSPRYYIKKSVHTNYGDGTSGNDILYYKFDYDAKTLTGYYYFEKNKVAEISFNKEVKDATSSQYRMPDNVISKYDIEETTVESLYQIVMQTDKNKDAEQANDATMKALGYETISEDELNNWISSNGIEQGSIPDDERSLLEKSIDGVTGILLYPAKAILVVIGLAIAAIMGGVAGSWSSTKSLGVDDIIFNKVQLTDINFFDFSVTDSTIKTIREGVAGWYVATRNLAAIILVIILIYVGIRMTISTIADEKAKYKEMLVNWIISLGILVFLHYIMIFTIQANNTIVDAIANAAHIGSKDTNFGMKFAKNAMLTAYFTDGMANAICFLALEFITFAFLITYTKRMITIGFLIIIAPLVTITYSVDKMGDGKSQALNNWLKEFVYNILIQPFDCIAYLALCSTVVDLADTAELQNAFLAICFLGFLALSAQQIVRRIFHFEAGSMPDPAASAAIGATLASKVSDLGKSISKEKPPKIASPQTAKTAPANGTGANNTTRQASMNLANGANMQDQGIDNGSNESNEANGINYTNLSNETNADNAANETNTVTNKKGGSHRAGNIAAAIGGALLNANVRAVGAGLGVAVGTATGKVDRTVASTIAGYSLGEAAGNRFDKDINKRSSRKNLARAFNDYQSESGLSEEEVKLRGQEFLDGDREAESEQERAYFEAVRKSANTYRRFGSDEKEMIKNTKDDLEEIAKGNVSEATGQVYNSNNSNNNNNNSNEENTQPIGDDNSGGSYYYGEDDDDNPYQNPYSAEEEEAMKEQYESQFSGTRERQEEERQRKIEEDSKKAEEASRKQMAKGDKYRSPKEIEEEEQLDYEMNDRMAKDGSTDVFGINTETDEEKKQRLKKQQQEDDTDYFYNNFKDEQQ